MKHSLIEANAARNIPAAAASVDAVVAALPEEQDRLALLLERGLGLTPTPHMLDAFIKQSKLRAHSLGIAEPQYMHLLELGGPSARAEWMAVAPALVVGETFLFRDAQLWNLIETALLPSIAALAKPIWMWSAGCSTGEEAYTLAIVARRALAATQTRILATDVNPKAIAAARVGVYGQWSLRGVDADKRDGLTVNGTQTVRVQEDVKSMVRFETHNLNDDASYPPAGMQSFELVICRNVLIYMSHPARARVVQRLASTVSAGGVLILGHGEGAGIDIEGLVIERHDAGVVYRRPLHPVEMAKPSMVIAVRPSAAPKRTAATRRKAPGVARRGTTAARAELRSASTSRAELRSTARASARTEVRPASTDSGQAKCREFVAAAIRAARENKYEQAERAAQSAIAAHQLDPEPHVLLAALMMARGALPAAEKELRRALFLDPVFVPALWQIGNLYGITNRKRQAAFAFARALTQLEGVSPDAEALPFDNLSVGELVTLLRAELGERVEA